MIPRKLLEAIFRRLWLLVIPVVVTPLIVIALTHTTPQYQSVATIWVSQPSNIGPSALGQAANPYLSAADAQTQVLHDLLTTKAFRADVAKSAGLPAGSAATTLVGQYVQVSSAGSNLIGIVATGPDPQLLQAVVNGVISEYQARSADESQRQTSIAVQYYTNQIDLANKELDTRRATLSAYTAAHPSVTDPKTSDLQYTQLVGAVDAQSQVVDGLTTALQDAQLRAASAPQSLEASFSVQDPANLPHTPEPVSMTKRFGYPIAALLFGILIAAAYVYVTYRTDHAIRSSEDLLGLAVPLLGVIPDLPPLHTRGFGRFAPWVWIPTAGRREYARAVAASISTVPAPEGAR
ncbi:MAG: hypothetical protein ACRDG3_13040 [Tepidiformaceae bacterium]